VQRPLRPTPTLRGLGLAVAGALLATGLGACDGDEDRPSGSSGPDHASTEEFCDAYGDLVDDVMSQASSGDSAAMIRALQDWAAEIEGVGTPEEMPEDARAGLELFVDRAGDLDEDASLGELENFAEDLTDDEQAHGEAFSTWTVENCPMDMSGLPSVDPSGTDR
jgi:hypothetical protein